MKFKKIVKNSLILITITIALLIGSAMLFTWLYHDKIINLCIGEINKHLKTKFSTGKVSLSIFDKFPDVSISFDNMILEGTATATNTFHPGSLVKAKNIFFTFNIRDMISGNYVINGIWLENAKIFLIIDENGNDNFTIFETTTSSENNPLAFDLKKIHFKNVLFFFDNLQTKQYYHILFTHTIAGLRYSDDLINISLIGDLLLYKIQFDKSVWFKQKDIFLNCDLIFNKKNEILKINPSVLLVENSQFSIYGKWVGGNETKEQYVNLLIEGKNTTAKTLLSLLPRDLYDKLSVYKSHGGVYFKGKINGYISETTTPAIEIDFGFNNASFYLPDSKHSIKKVNFKGKFSNGGKNNKSPSFLTLSGIKAELDGKPLKGSFLLKNFDSPYLKFNIDADIDIATLLAFYPNEKIDYADGSIYISMSLSGDIEQLKQINISKNFNTSGEFSLRDVNLKLKDISLDFNNFNGDFLFNKNDIAVSDFSGKIGNSNFMINGFFRNLIPYLLFENQTLYIEADLDSDRLDLDELLSTDYTVHTDFSNETDEEKEYRFSVSPDLSFVLGCDIGLVKFRRFRGKNITGKLTLKDQMIRSDNISINVGGGILYISGMVNAKDQKEIVVTTKAEFDKIHIDSIFYIFENFDQDFIMDKHLKGQISAHAVVKMFFNSNLSANTDKLIADIDASILNGQLIKFEPMQNLSKFIDEKRLANLKFFELKNSIHIEDRIIYFPEMEIRSNVTTISVMGSHSFDQNIDYKLRIPLKNIVWKYPAIFKDKAIRATEKDEHGVITLYLTIKGTTDDYKIAYDSERVKVKIRKSWQKEKEEFTDLFKEKPMETVEPDTATLLDEDEYFDF